MALCSKRDAWSVSTKSEVLVENVACYGDLFWRWHIGALECSHSCYGHFQIQVAFVRERLSLCEASLSMLLHGLSGHGSQLQGWSSPEATRFFDFFFCLYAALKRSSAVYSLWVFIHLIGRIERLMMRFDGLNQITHPYP